MYSVKLIVKS